MGQELECTLRVGKKSTKGKALLETDHVVFRGGDVRLKIAFASMKRVAEEDGELVLVHEGGEARLSLGARAAKWADAIRNPKSVVDKLGVKPSMRVAVIAVDDAAFLRDLRARADDVTEQKPKADSDVIFFGVRTPKDFDRLPALKRALKPNGALWIVREKGKHAKVSESAAMAAGKAAGLVDVKVVRLSDALTAEKFVIPVADR